MCFTSYGNDVRDNRGSRQLLTFLGCLHCLLFSVARAEQLQGCSRVPSVALPAAIAFAQEFLEWCMLLQHFLCSGHAFDTVIPSGAVQWEYRFLRYAALPPEPLTLCVLHECWIQQLNDFVMLLQRNTGTKLLSEADRQAVWQQPSELNGFIFMF